MYIMYTYSHYNMYCMAGHRPTRMYARPATGLHECMQGRLPAYTNVQLLHDRQLACTNVWLAGSRLTRMYAKNVHKYYHHIYIYVAIFQRRRFVALKPLSPLQAMNGLGKDGKGKGKRGKSIEAKLPWGDGWCLAAAPTRL